MSAFLNFFSLSVLHSNGVASLTAWELHGWELCKLHAYMSQLCRCPAAGMMLGMLHANSSAPLLLTIQLLLLQI